jgi:hypothetical protein
MLILIWPASVLLLLLIVPLEAVIAFRILKTDYRQSLKLSIIANLVSALAGIPVTWVGLAMVQHLVDRGHAWGIATPLQKILAVTVQSPWLMPHSDSWAWMVPAAAISLCVPFFFMSVWLEYLCCKSLLSSTASDRLLLKWSWIANAWSYGLISIGLIITAVVGATHS